MTRSGILLLGLTAIVAVMVATVAFALLKFFAAAREFTRRNRQDGSETAFMTGALEDAVQRLRVRERAMTARAEASERLSSEIIASMTSGLLVVGQDRQVRSLNPAGQRMLAISADQASSVRDFRDVLARAQSLADVIDECLQTAQPVLRRSVRLPEGGAGASHLGVTVSPIRDETGHAHGAICLFTDLSEIVDLEDQLRLKDSLARLGEMTAGIAHEFRNGLATIHGYARLIDLNQLAPELQQYVQGIRDETEALGQVVTNFLNFAKPAQLTLGQVDMAILADRAADDIRADAASRQGTVSVQGEFGCIEGDEVLLRQALSNLCRNAIEACAAAGVGPHIVIEGTIDTAQRQQRITVTDNGPGVDEANAARIFRPFFTTKAQGTGLGLALVQKVIVTHNGRIAVEPRPGAGARFLITLPLESHPAPVSVS
jgi:nitrogen fixation/metabolism regulation signal transduction histidine kinase